MGKTKLSVNVNKLATLRNSRGKNNPDVLQTALKIVDYGAEGITVHPRPDERHVRRTDVVALSAALKKYPHIEFNIEGYPSEDYLQLIEQVRPHQATLVPDPPEALTSNAGWKVAANKKQLKERTNYVNDESEGKYTQFYENGKVSEEGTYQNGEKVGVWVEYYENGRKMHSGEYKKSQKNGVWSSWDEHGQIKKLKWQNGNPIWN